MSLLFRDDAHLREAQGTVVAVTDAGAAVDRALFYPTGSG